MDNATIAAIVTCLITGLLSAGGWKFYEAVLKSRAEQRKEEKLERMAYRDDLIARVDKLEKENLIRVNDTTEGKKILSISEVHGELMNENTILKDNVYQLEKQLNTSRKKLVDKLV